MTLILIAGIVGIVGAYIVGYYTGLDTGKKAADIAIERYHKATITKLQNIGRTNATT